MRETGSFKIKIFRTRTNQQIPRETPGILLEATSAYFEAYHHVLTALQSIQEDNLPFHKYIVYCNCSVVMPNYLAIDPDVKFDLGPMLSINQARYESSECSEEEVLYSDSDDLELVAFTKYVQGSEAREKRVKKADVEKYLIKVTDINRWLSAEELGMDESQRAAYISALTKEFVLIQGPPGTGKTYIGLQIAKTLLHNKDKWKITRHYDHDGEKMIEKKQCLLIVCYTNHALDQFVEGIIRFIPERELNNGIPAVIRIGNQSKNSAVDKYSIKNQRYKVRKRRHAQDVIEAADRTKYDVLTIRAILKIIQGQNSVLFFRQLKPFMLEHHILNFQKDPLNDWLDWIHISPKSWFHEVQRKKSQKKRRRKPIQTKASANSQQPVINIVTEAEYQYSERSLDENVEFSFNVNWMGIDVNNQLSQILTDVQDETCQEILQEEAEVVSNELKAMFTANDFLIERTENLWNLSLENRWKLYRHWLRKYVEYLKERLQIEENKFSEIFEDYKKARAELDEEILRQASVIAMTTTGAAKYHEVLMKIGPQITIIEEAAEVPEAHIVTAINPECEHLILIGDHKQLEPKPAVRELATRFNLSISLFERMLNNGLEYDCLQRQHRMRPEISELVRHMYPKLYDNANVLEYENVSGIRQNLFFINHEHQEQRNEDGKSFSNEHEAEYVKELCTYLLKQGYKRNDITILAAYTGQMFLIRSKMPRAHFEGINISVLDNYQGEENEIIVLSLVRNNKNGDIGFLRRENRICVALSRAKKGLYIIGNSETLTKDSKEWRTVLQKIKSNNKEDTNHACPRQDCGTSFGNALPLYCQNHPEQEGIRAELPGDFARAPEGGCELFCGLRLECGHVCRLRCHPYDKDHVEYECRKMCPNVCEENHKCNKHCHFPQSCDCEVIIERTLQCHHTAKLKCHIDPSEYQCLVEMKRTLKCDHSIILKCHIDYDKYMCRETVTSIRDNCGHEYSRKCFDIAFERKHLCEIKVDKTLKCGHTLIIKCHQNRDGSYFSCCFKNCLKLCDNNHICDRACHFPKKCHCSVEINKTLPRCGHVILIECSKEVDQFTTCREKVDFILEICGHHQKLSCSEKYEIETTEPKKRQLLEKLTKCREIISVDLPQCGHTTLAECWKSFEIKEVDKGMLKYIQDMYDLKCSKEVVFNLECGHLITTMCYKKLSYDKNSALTQKEGRAGIECATMVDLNLVCGHTITVKCFERFRYEKIRNGFCSSLLARKNTNYKCTAVVDIELKCGHMGRTECWEKENQMRNSLYKVNVDCKALVEIQMGKCGHTKMVECFQSNTQFICHEKSVYTYPKCGHERYFECWQHPDMKKQQLRAQTELRRGGMGRRYNYREGVDCKIPLCEHLIDKQLSCGHKITVSCSMSENAVCNQNCEHALVCGHACTITCRECEENITHKDCMRKCGKLLFCGHNCDGKTCMQCTPCEKLCSFSCAHDICKLNCKDICVPCKNACTWKCPHFQCSKLCSEECDRPLCLKDCEHKLTCGHKCPGFCSEPCPVSCKDCDAANFMEGNEGIKTVTINECGHSFGYRYLDGHMEKTANDLISKCPACGQVFYWHPRYDKILKKKKTLTEKLMENFQKVTKQSNYKFPLCDSKIVQQFHNYIGSFNTYVQIISYIARDTKNVKIKSLQTSAENILKAMRKTTSKCLQNWIDISDAIFRLYVKWMLQLITSNEKLLEKKYRCKIITQNQEEGECAYSHDINAERIDSSSEFIELKTKHVIKDIKNNDRNTKFEVNDLSAMFEENDTVSLNRESNSMKNGCDGDTSTDQKVEEISQTEVTECLTGLDIVRRIEDTMISNQKSEVKRLLNIMIPFMRNEPHFTEAMQCPQLTSVTAIGVHEKDWKICKEGHLTSTLIHQNCYACYAASSSKVSGESKEGVLWKTHFQPLTENFERDRYHQGKGNKMGAQQGRNKRNKSNKNWISETFEKDTKQTNIQEVRTHVQGSNHPSGNVTLLDYIHTNTVGTNRGNSRGRGRGRGKKKQQTYDVAGSSFQNRPAGYQGYNTDFNSSVERPKRGNSASNFMQSNFGRSTENRGTCHNGIWQRNTVPHHEQVVSHHDPVAGHNEIWQRNIVPHHEQVAGTFGIHMQQSTIYNEPNENFKPFKGGFGRPKYVPGSSDSHPGRGGQRGRGRRGRRGGRGDRN